MFLFSSGAQAATGVGKVTKAVIENDYSMVFGEWGYMISGLIVTGLILFAVMSRIIRKYNVFKSTKSVKEKDETGNEVEWIIAHFKGLEKKYIDLARQLKEGMPPDPMEHLANLDEKYIKIVRHLSSYTDHLDQESPLHKALKGYRVRLEGLHDDVADVYTVYYDMVWTENQNNISEDKEVVYEETYKSMHEKANEIWAKWQASEGERRKDLLSLIGLSLNGIKGKGKIRAEVDERRNWARNEFILRIGNVTGNFQNAFKIELSSKALVAAGKDEEETIVSSLEGWDVISRIEGKWKQRGARDIYNEVMATESVYLPESEYRSDNDAFYGTWRAHDLSDLFLEDENSRPIIENVILEDCRNLREKIISGGTIFSRESESAVGVNFLSRNARGIISTAVVLLIFLAAGWMFTSARNAFEKYVSFETIPAAGDDAAHKGERAPPSEAEEDQPTIAEQISELTRALNDILGETDISDQNTYSSEGVVRINEIKNKLKELEEEHVVLYGAIKTVQDKAESWKYASGHIDGMQGLQALSSEREPVIGPGFQSLNMPSIPGYWGTMDESLGGKMPMCSTETDIVKEDKDMGVPVIGFITVNP